MKIKAEKKKALPKEKTHSQHEMALSQAKKTLGDSCVCCILIACSHASEPGNMQVDMHFEGDEVLAGFLLESARDVFDEKFSQQNQ